jgi:hypothetical protein
VDGEWEWLVRTVLPCCHSIVRLCCIVEHGERGPQRLGANTLVLFSSLDAESVRMKGVFYQSRRYGPWFVLMMVKETVRSDERLCTCSWMCHYSTSQPSLELFASSKKKKKKFKVKDSAT